MSDPTAVNYQRSFFLNSPHPYCHHTAAVEVRRALDGELVAWLCPDCEQQLDVDWADPRAAAAQALIAAGYDPHDAIRVTALDVPADADGLAGILKSPESMASYFSEESRANGTTQAFVDSYRRCVHDRRERDKDHPSSQCPQRVEITAMRDSEPRYMHGNCAP